MTLAEFKETISKAPEFEWFNNISDSFDFPYLNYSQNFKGIVSIYEFVNKQVLGWRKLESAISNSFTGSLDYFERLEADISNFVRDYINSEKNILQSVWYGSVIQRKNQRNIKAFLYNCPETQFLIGVKINFPNAFKGALCYITGDLNNNFNDKNYLTGVLLGYEFTLKDQSQIVERRNIEKSSISKIRNDFEKQISTADLELVNYFKRTNDNFTQYVQEFETLKQDKANAFEDWFSDTQTKFTEFDNRSKKITKELEITYEELLRLKKPAEYWKLRAGELKRQGWISLGILIGLVVIGCIMLFSLLWLTPDDMLKSFFNNDKSAAIRWSIIFITLISFFAFGIRALTKVTFSSFHLARDAEERERLTFVYLAMVKDSSVEKEDRHLIMQSLFSRADTGLLKEDSSPTMPGASGMLGSIVGRN
jgi:hypothetical protein